MVLGNTHSCPIDPEARQGDDRHRCVPYFLNSLSGISPVAASTSNIDKSKYCEDCVYVCLEPSAVLPKSKLRYEKYFARAQLRNLQYSPEMQKSGLSDNGHSWTFNNVKWIALFPCAEDATTSGLWKPAEEYKRNRITFIPTFGACVGSLKINSDVDDTFEVEACDSTTRSVVSMGPRRYDHVPGCRQNVLGYVNVHTVVTRGHPALAGRMSKKGYSCQKESIMGDREVKLKEFEPLAKTYMVGTEMKEMTKEDLQLCANCIYKCTGW
jgi:hypothetical protein